MTKGKEARPHIGIFGRRNNGKSTFINKLSGQELSIVSEVAGTTTDPVSKAMEIGGLGPVVFIDTAGIDDAGPLGQKRVQKTLETLKTIDLAILLIAENKFGQEEEALLQQFKEWDVPFMIIHSKEDIEHMNEQTLLWAKKQQPVAIDTFSSVQSNHLSAIIQTIRSSIPESAYKSQGMVGDLLKYGDVVMLITPIDIEAPEGRLILPQVQAIRDILDNDAIAIVVKEREADAYIRKMQPQPSLVITDSQIFTKADAIVPKHIPLTSFSILLARQRGDFQNYLKGTPMISKLKDNDRVLLLESCTHQVSCDDIGRVKIPRWINNFTGKKIDYEVVSGLNKLPRPITDYALVIQCGGCMITRRQIINRLKPAIEAGIPVTNYGMAIAWVQGIYPRAIAPFTGQTTIYSDYL
ncbi:MAG: small GTP-binding protein [Bacteroidetes bacterium 38_7]|jgi:[FeFe] hydrogenase H-cluster maturation GTPase HydF|nr:MAG: small GTP-binding protein [Bacteroidetes bacterium 38_7]HAL64793.1 [FeFe] hydrogenase H-cluster maturation GTPase HydF [Bacteroidales bacterium]HQN97945.1 [FeFe] hydrogenase H-cluster maturation GTPase HydF [Bacteroidales bacterium]HQQ02200.1 [FeFe] hydrogenase H-cluster maturation GTPase HydF [Bacteroidales bacterium]